MLCQTEEFVFMRILLYTLLFSACTSGDLGSRFDRTSGEKTPVPQPTPNDQVAACLKLCTDACDDWGAWSALSPAANTVCKGKTLTQSQSRTRTCKATCRDVQCLKTESKEVEADGTKVCTEEPPQPPLCQTSCVTGCKAKVFGNWSPAESSQCKDDPFTQTRGWTRKCSSPCDGDDKANCLCTGITCESKGDENKDATGTLEIDCETACDKDDISWGDWLPAKQADEVCKGTLSPQTREGMFKCPRDTCNVCATETTAQRNLKGTKVTPCGAPHCTAWQAVSGTGGTWQPAPDTKPEGETFTQTRKEERTCKLTCPDPANPCATTREGKRTVKGTKKPITTKTNNTPPTKVVKEVESDPPPPVVQPPVTCNQCITGCEAWQAWGAWTAETSCPTTLAFGSALPQESIERRSRARTCNNNLCADAVCFTSNSETRTTACSCPAGKVLADDGTCVCDAADRKYRVGNECQQCPSDYNFQEVDGTWVCEQTCTCCDAWVEQSVSQQASDVCANLTFTPKYTYTRSCSICPAANTCSETKTELASVPVPGTKTTKNCGELCTAWGAWSWTAARTCPANTSFASSTITYKGKRTRTCSGLCSASDCDTTDNTGSKTKNCAYCEGAGQKKLTGGTCVCDAGGRYYRTGNTCTQCPADREFQNGNCRACTAQEELQNGVCKECASNEELKDGVCVAKPSEEPPLPEEETSVEVEVEHETCKAGCDNWDMTNWAWTLTTDACQDPASFAKLTLTAEIATRTRTRECEHLTAGLECFTSNTETKTTACHWCQGTGQAIDTKDTARLDDDECVCKHSSGYREVNGECKECSTGQVWVESNGTWQCSNKCDDVCGAWVAGGDGTPVASDVCSGDKFTPQQTWERTTCPTERTDCARTKTVKGEETVGTKTVVCDDACSDYGDFGDWTAAETCPTSTPLGAKPSIAEKRTKTRTCPQELCGATCPTKEIDTQQVDCACVGTGQSLIDGTCVCDAGGRYYRTGNTCTECPADREFQNGVCVAKPSTPEVEEEDSVEVEEEEDSVEVEMPEFNETCAAGCTWAPWTDWSAEAECPAKSSFTKPPANTVKSRSRSAECENLKAGLECFTANTESKTCEWCKGKGQKLDDDMDDVCLCDAHSNYYRDRETDRCESCGNKIVNSTRNGCECEDSSCIANGKKEWDSTNCVCGECKHEYVNECSGSINKETCACEVITSPPSPPSPPATMQVRLYHGCFYMSLTHPLYMPLTPSKMNKDKWKNACLSTADYTYEDAATTLQQATTATVTVTQIIQTLYNCAKDSASDRTSVQKNKLAFVNELIDNNKQCLDRASHPYWVTITID